MAWVLFLELWSLQHTAVWEDSTETSNHLLPYCPETISKRCSGEIHLEVGKTVENLHLPATTLHDSRTDWPPSLIFFPWRVCRDFLHYRWREITRANKERRVKVANNECRVIFITFPLWLGKRKHSVEHLIFSNSYWFKLITWRDSAWDYDPWITIACKSTSFPWSQGLFLFFSRRGAPKSGKRPWIIKLIERLTGRLKMLNLMPNISIGQE